MKDVFSVVLAILWGCSRGYTACAPCADYQPGVPWGTLSATAISEASGLAASRRNAGVLWTHNDGARERVYAISTNGALLGTFTFNPNVEDLEDMAVGPGPVSGISYLYIGDMGGQVGTNETRPDIMIVRAAEPRVTASSIAPNTNLESVDTFRLVYPDGSYDAEALLLDPITLDLLVLTKDSFSTRVYRANVATATNQAQIPLEFVRTLTFTNVSGGSVSHDGSQILLRREDAALLWARCENEAIVDALGGTPQALPVIGPPVEPNGESITFANNGSGYITVSEGSGATIFFFEGRCPSAPEFVLPLQDQAGFVGGDARFETMIVAYPEPIYTWRFDGAVLPGQTNASLTLTALSATNVGAYEVTASNSHGSVTSAATLSVRTRPNLRITEVQSDAAPNTTVDTADWWELTNFEQQPVNLSGWRFNDSGGGLGDPFTLPGGISIAPGESIIFVDSLTPAEFRAWWGAADLPASLQIVSYNGNGLGLAAGGDGLRLWNSSTTNAADAVASVDFGAADPGVSFNFDPLTEQFGAKSVLGHNGVFRASAGADIGSPGRIVGPAPSPQLTATLMVDSLRLEFDVVVGHRYSLQTRSDMSNEPWGPTGDSFMATNNIRVRIEKPLGASARFYRLAVD